MDNDYFNKLITSLDRLSPHQLNRLEREISTYRSTPLKKVLSNEELLMLNHIFKKNIAM